MLVAVNTGIPAAEWLADTRALFTAALILKEQAEAQADSAKKAKRGRRRRG